MGRAPDRCCYCADEDPNCGFCTLGVPLDTQKDWDRTWGKLLDPGPLDPDRHPYIEAAIHGWKVGRLLNGDVVTGTARAIAHPGGGFAGSKDDIRDLCLHVTLTSGFEAWWPIAEMVDQLRGGEFVAPYEP